MLGDVDGLKELNDRLGHLAGDRTLEAIGRVLQKGRREVDAVFRIGGDEFALILPEVSEDEARSVIERITETIRSQRRRAAEGRWHQLRPGGLPR